MRLPVFVLLCFMLGGVLNAQDDPFTPAPCRAGMPENMTVECGFLSVPEDHTDPQSETIRLSVAIFRAVNPTHDDPILYLHGGPTRSSVDAVLDSFSVYRPYMETRDFIVFDPRGIGRSEPDLGCRELRLLPDDPSYDDRLEAFETCRQRLIDEGRVLSAYTTRAIVQDMDDLRRALGYDTWNLFGISYGSRVALTALRDTPAAIRSVILDSVYPPDANLVDNLANGADRAFSALFDDCAADRYCNAAYPNLESRFYALVDRLNADPIDLTQAYAEDTLSGDRLVRLLFDLLYNSDLIASVPLLIDQLEGGNLSALWTIRSRFFSDGYDRRIDSMLREVIDCNEEIAFNMVEVALRQNLPVVLYDFARDVSQVGLDLCATWTTTPTDPVETLPVTGDTPALIITGEYDPITPPEWGLKTRRNLTNSVYITYPRRGHGVSLTAGCPREHVLAFLDDPFAAPDESCLDRDPPFATPEVSFVPFTDDDYDIEGILPAGWLPGPLPGNYQRTSLQQVLLAQLTYFDYDHPGSLNFLAGVYDFSPVIDPVDRLETDTLNWSIYAIRGGYYTTIALAENGANTHVVTLSSPRPEHAVNVEAILYPVLEAFTPLTE